MKRNLAAGLLLATAGWLQAAESNLKSEVSQAAAKLKEQPNYSWKTTVVVPEGTRFRPGPTEGQTEKGGLTHVTWTFGENKSEAVLKGEKAAVLTGDGGWQALSELDTSQGRGRFLGFIVRNLKTPAVQAAELASGAVELKKQGEVYAGDLTEEAAKGLLRFRGGGGDGPAVSDAKGSAKFWVKEGMLSKYEFKVVGKMSFNNNDIDVDRVTTVEIKDVGKTQMKAPEEAKKKLE